MECPLWVFWRIKFVPYRGSTVHMMTSWHGHAFRFTADMWGESAGHWFEIPLRSCGLTTMESLCGYFVEEWAWCKEVRLRVAVSHSSSYHVAPTETTNKTALQLYWRWTVYPSVSVCLYLYCTWRSVFKLLLEWTVPCAQLHSIKNVEPFASRLIHICFIYLCICISFTYSKSRGNIFENQSLVCLSVIITLVFLFELDLTKVWNNLTSWM